MQVGAGTTATNYIHNLIEVQFGNNDFLFSRLPHNMHQHHERELYFCMLSYTSQQLSKLSHRFHAHMIYNMIRIYWRFTFQELLNVVGCKAQHYSPRAIYSYPHASKLLRNTALTLYQKGSYIPSNCIKYPTYQNPKGTNAKMNFKVEKFHFSYTYVYAYTHACVYEQERGHLLTMLS